MHKRCSLPCASFMQSFPWLLHFGLACFRASRTPCWLCLHGVLSRLLYTWSLFLQLFVSRRLIASGAGELQTCHLLESRPLMLSVASWAQITSTTSLGVVSGIVCWMHSTTEPTQITIVPGSGKAAHVALSFEDSGLICLELLLHMVTQLQFGATPQVQHSK